MEFTEKEKGTGAPPSILKIWKKVNWEQMKAEAPMDPSKSRYRLVERINKLHAAHDEHFVIMSFKRNLKYSCSWTYFTPGIAADFMSDKYGQLIQSTWPLIMKQKSADKLKNRRLSETESIVATGQEERNQKPETGDNNGTESQRNEADKTNTLVNSVINVDEEKVSAVEKGNETMELSTGIATESNSVSLPGPSNEISISSMTEMFENQQREIAVQEFLHHMVDESAVRRCKNGHCIEEDEVHVKVDDLVPHIDILLNSRVIEDVKKYFTDDAYQTLESTLKCLKDLKTKNEKKEVYNWSGKGKGKRLKLNRNQEMEQINAVEETMFEIQNAKTTNNFQGQVCTDTLELLSEFETQDREIALEECITEDYYPIDRLVGKRRIKGKIFYEVMWQGHATTTMEPAANIPLWIRKAFVNMK